eukprot:CAMPEP_0182460176 /NCGR_PEP_ID=MMETSP1319-20130603/5118_1 /TAXON_ID=172717 /ORGANISM="Bolidomonas pacifica, Strain RCC208" /LENGTH=202 /DNA_ID=CAMNT_0024659233 /DNA_START=39 /DNA_END=643 /DNA_ORIENTATION=-
MAARLAKASHSRALSLSPLVSTWPDLYGVSATATIVSHYKRRGDYRVHVATCDSEGDVNTLCFTFVKGYRSRENEDAAVGFLALRGLYEAAGKSTGKELPPEAAAPDWIVTEMPKEPVVNEVGEEAQGVEEIPALVSFQRGGSDGASDDGGEWKVIVDGRTILAPPSSALPRGTVIVLPSAGMDVGKIYGEALAAFGVPNRS